MHLYSLILQASEFSIRTQLKTVKKKEFAMDEGEAEASCVVVVRNIDV